MPQVFLFSISLLFVIKYYYFVEAYSLQCNGLSQNLIHSSAYVLQAENNMAGRAYMGEVLTKVWLKSVKK